jgi:fibro-slime domain-containing protein
MRISYALPLLLCAACGSGAGNDVDNGPGGGDLPDASISDPDAGGGDPVESCGVLRATIRDFRADHPDFEEVDARQGDDRGIVRRELGSDGKPVYAHDAATRTVSGKASFDQWYRTSDVNMAFEIDLPLAEPTPGNYVFDDSEFYPLDGQGFAGEERNGHNYHFTTEIHATFRYRGGERFTFTGDDDVFVFVNGRLALDLGGVHGAEDETIDFDAAKDELGISAGGVYSLDVFHAERHLVESNFRIETSIDCFIEVD